jgi:CTP:phosphocholine cytidylyltransferase-like protein
VNCKTIDTYWISREKSYAGEREVLYHAKKEINKHYICDSVEIRACNIVSIQWEKSIPKSTLDKQITKEEFLKEMDNALAFITNIMMGIQ